MISRKQLYYVVVVFSAGINHKYIVNVSSFYRVDKERILESDSIEMSQSSG